MAKISTYPKDTNISLSDKLLGTDAESSLATKNYEIGDFVTFIQGQFNTTLQDVTEEGANTTVQMQINGVNVATVNDITGTPTLQEVVAEGNTVSGGAYINVTNGSLSAWVMGGNVNVSNAVNTMDVFASGLLFQKQFGTGSVELTFPNTINDARVIEFPNASGIIALTNDLVTPNLQQVTDEGANTTVQMQINGVNVATVNDIDIIPTFKAFITQAGSATPIFSTVSKNTTGKTFTIARQNAGVFLIEPNVPFTNIEKVFISVQNQGGYNVLNSISISNTQLFWLTYDFNGVSGDLIDYSTITIEILP